MSREAKFTGIILKKQPFNEGDEIITFFTKEQGKIRGLAKSVKLAKSKLQQRLQSLFLLELTLTQSAGLPKIISAEPLKVYGSLRQNLTAAKMAFYASELVLKFTPDESKNEPLFNLLSLFLEFLDSQKDEEVLNLGLAKFKIEVLETSGFAITQPVGDILGDIFFSSYKGGFSSEKSADALTISKQAYKTFAYLTKTDLPGIKNNSNSIPELQRLLSGLIEYHLERKVKSEKYI